MTTNSEDSKKRVSARAVQVSGPKAALEVVTRDVLAPKPGHVRIRVQACGVCHSDLHLIPDAGVGFYYSQNSAGKEHSSIRGPLFLGFMNRYFPAPAQNPEPTLKSAQADGARVTGMYDISRRSDSSFLRIASEQAKVTLNDDATISVDSFLALNGEPRKWREM